MRVKPIIWICILSFFASIFYNELNLSFIPEQQLRSGETIITNDDLSYLRPADNYYNTGVWKDEIAGNISYFLRPPGYGIFYLIGKYIYPTNPLRILKILQVLLFAFSIYSLYKIGLTIIGNSNWALFLACLYGISPFAIGFLYYSLSEGITPSLLLFYLHFLLNGLKETNKSKWWLLSALCFSFLFIVRPVLGIFVILLPFAIYFSKDTKKLIKGIVYSAIAFSSMITWQIRNYNIANEYVGLHPIYYPDNNTLYRPPVKAFGNLMLAWGAEGQDFHECTVPFWFSIIEGDESNQPVQDLINKLPPQYVDFFGKERIYNIFKKYQESIIQQRPFYLNKLAMPGESMLETELTQEFDQLRKEFIEEYPMEYYVITPLKVFKRMAFHSNLSLFIFQKEFRGNWFMETIRFIFFSLHSLSFCVIILLFLFYRKKWSIEYGLILSLFIYCFYIFYVQRGIEERYTLPILPIVLVFSFNCVKEKINRLVNTF